MRDPIRCFQGEAKYGEPFWKVQNAVQGTPEIEFKGPISEFVMLDEQTLVRMADVFKTDLNNAGQGGPVTVRVNSPGGDIFAASALRAVMLDYPGEITTRVDTVCGSCATYLLTAGKYTVMLDTSFVAIHDPYFDVFFAQIDIATGQQLVDQLKTFKDGILGAYESRTGMSRDRLAKMMTATTWMSARDALQFGFADEILIPGKQSTPMVEKSFAQNLMTYYGNIPVEVMNMVELIEPPTPPVDEVFERAVETLRDTLTLHNMQKETL